MLELSKHHGAVLVLVVELQALQEVLKRAHLLRLLDLSVDGIKLLELDELFALLLGAAQLLDHLEGGVKVETPEALAEVEHVDPGLALKVVNVEGELGP